MATNIPMRYNIIIQLIKHPEGLNPAEILEILAPVYKGEKQCNEKEIDSHLMSLKGTGLTEITNTVERDDGVLESNYVITNYGKERAQKYIGKFL